MCPPWLVGCRSGGRKASGPSCLLCLPVRQSGCLRVCGGALPSPLPLGWTCRPTPCSLRGVGPQSQDLPAAICVTALSILPCGFPCHGEPPCPAAAPPPHGRVGPNPQPPFSPCSLLKLCPPFLLQLAVTVLFSPTLIVTFHVPARVRSVHPSASAHGCPGAQEAALNEVRVLSRLHHPHIIGMPVPLCRLYASFGALRCSSVCVSAPP